MRTLSLIPPGPVSAAFIEDRSPFSGLLGPMGSGKTSSCVLKILRIGQEQAPSPVDGVRYTKWGVVRDTFQNLKGTTMQTIKGWFPEGAPGVEWGGGGSSKERPFCKLTTTAPGDTRAHIWFEFLGIDEHNIEDLAKGWELTGYWLNEGDLLSPDIKEWLDGRIGRYPSRLQGGASWYGGMADYNAPDTENYLYELLEETKPEGHKLFRQPSGLSADAENTKNLPPGYYERIAKGKPDWWVRRNIEARYGYSREGKPVYSKYNDDLHCAGRTIEPVDGIPIRLYTDAELNPAMVFVQFLGNGQMIILDELYMRGGAVQLGRAARNLLATEYPGFRFVGRLADPAADRGNAQDLDAGTWIDVLNKEMGLEGADRFRAAPTNDPAKRQDAVNERLTTLLDGGQPALMVSAKAKVARKGFNSDYRFKIRSNGETDDRPEKKHPVSDVHDAIQYAALDEGGYEEVSAREVRRKRVAGSKPIVAKVEVRF